MIIEDASHAISDAATVRLGSAGMPKAIAPEDSSVGLNDFLAGVRRVARELVTVFASSVAGLYIADNVNTSAIKKSTAAFVGKPTF